MRDVVVQLPEQDFTVPVTPRNVFGWLISVCGPVEVNDLGFYLFVDLISILYLYNLLGGKGGNFLLALEHKDGCWPSPGHKIFYNFKVLLAEDVVRLELLLT